MARDFQALFAQAEWKQVEASRSWVRFRNDKAANGLCWHVQADGEPLISVIIPTADADRGGYFNKLMASLSAQEMQSFELIVLKGDRRQGRGINISVDFAKGKYILTLDDDSSLPDSKTFSKLVDAMDEHLDIGMAGGNNTVPDWATPFVRRVMQQVPRRSWKPVTEIVDSDLAEHPCLIMRAALFREVGGENEQIPRGLDPYLRKVFRETGSRVVILPGIIYHHLPPETWKKLLTQFYRNGRHAAYANIHSPEWVIETPSEHGEFIEYVPLWKRIFRFPVRMLASLLQGKWVWVICEACYAWGFLVGWVTEKAKQKG
ncbi:MAG: hypothetical protein COW19_05515 [Zetaproteobacteria bacterium CG12_big_fil_rev_8_21_14_0_65_55_1124]|nr:MAG: hypothetical protein AUJ58_07805 [Zetaproteobacteria bacterium CG1_02_55_237]PIS19243.1 MAG: hypothetical protein COT53_06875 [Zetaproteobacteria bacterium CG08_land_8_20_14_0_20_55_17]PIW42896.1 MAG: hypothetical protein COW19_05515 [Zetaproteobacteria bacterium CG12_big_fil_rev_8_21_14_0_65_55_1124]PIY51880.1 MAG: hypothetical protein COZ01_09860 [Zetaproteobacteria bacterium CG_4_10_14_0_8_um_filter_55_43]PIZ39940.1 MAG: hypothetical protein COY36_01515 [Zetaproteobacteria bacterium 